jgi:Ca2+-binding RTX toxin-like protein
MLHLTVFDVMGSTGPTVIYGTGRPTIRITDDEIQVRAKIQGGRFAGEVEVLTLEGRFKEDGRGKFDEWESRVDGKLHYRIEYDDPIRFSAKDLEAAARDGIEFVGNKFNNSFDGDRGRDQLKGAGGDDRLRGLDGNDKLIGSGGDDILAGGDGSDRVDGGKADDGLEGGAGKDRLSGGPGRDLLIGGPDADRLIGGGDVDRFRFREPSDSRPGKGRDEIVDFTSGTDLIDLSEIDARPRSKKDDKFVFIGDADFNDRAGELRFDRSMLQADLNGDGRADFNVFLSNDLDVLKDALIL